MHYCAECLPAQRLFEALQHPFLLAGLLPVLAAVMDKATQNILQLGRGQQADAPSSSLQQGKKATALEDELARPMMMSSFWQRRFPTTLLLLWRQIAQGWPYGEYLSYGKTGLACTAAALSKLTAAVLTHWSAVACGTAQSTTSRSSSASGGHGTSDSSSPVGSAGTSNGSNNMGGKKGKDNMLSQECSDEDLNLDLQLEATCAALWYVRMCDSDFLDWEAPDSWDPPKTVKELMPSDHTLILTLTVLAGQVQAQHAARAAASQQQQQHIPDHHLQLLQLLQCPPLAPTIAKALLDIPCLTGAKQLSNAWRALVRLYDCRQRSTACMVLPAACHTPIILVLVEAMLLSPDLYFMQCCCSLIQSMIGDLKRVELSGGANADEACIVLREAAATFAREALLRLGPAVRQAWSLERQTGSPGAQYGGHDAAASCPDLVLIEENRRASNAKGMLAI